MASDRVHQPLQQASIKHGTRVAFVLGGVEYKGTASSPATLDVTIIGGIVVSVTVDGTHEKRNLPLSILRLI
ncbi:hypothetical protein AURDEDRAFT_164646 [Auricularia subglabra TFB-10046 SS5]|nr:hypothetical protein AURDEDRAFT_164646 [Auricularia subglabra TFB-10046 SS5]